MRFEIFSRHLGRPSVLLPLRVTDLCLFVSDLHRQGLQPSSIASHLSALGHFQKMSGFKDSTKHFLVQKLVTGARRLSPGSQVRLPITSGVLQGLVAALKVSESTKYCRLLLHAMFTTAFHAFLRIGEIAPKTVKGQGEVVQLSDISWQQDAQCVLTLHKFKNSHKQGSQSFTLRKLGKADKTICPIRALKKYLEMRSKKQGPLFVLNGHPCLRRYFDDRLRAALVGGGYCPKSYKGHSFRIGAATEAASRGMSDAQIRNLGRWQSDAFRKYIRLSHMK